MNGWMTVSSINDDLPKQRVMRQRKRLLIGKIILMHECDNNIIFLRAQLHAN